MQKIKTSDWLINPIFIFLSLWGMQALGHIVFLDSFYPFVTDTWVIVFFGGVAFVVGCFFANIFNGKYRHTDLKNKEYVPRFIKICIKFLLPAYILGVALPLIISIFFDSTQSLSELRNSLIDSVGNNDREVILISYLHYLIVIASLLSISCAPTLRGRVVTYIAITGMLAGFLTFGRVILLLYFSSLSIILYFQGRIKKKIAFFILFSFVVIFFLLAFLLNKGGSENNIFESIAWNFKVYVLSGLAGFNNYVAKGDPDISGWLLVPNFIKNFLSALGVQSEITPSLFPFVETPLPGNVYTAFFPWYHDGGILAVCIGFFIIGFISMFLFKNRYKSKLSLFNYSLSLYPLIMSIFEEQYLRAYPLWAIVFLLYVFLYIFEGFKIRKI
ncbi:macromolecule metabolism; macromolecule synthesis [Collimonas arenae]|uniref:Macromolecule metabolism macromolecule synthesis n=1 Tax=Collimonas arenae TaxID=279058 RepID=A0A0A1F5R1_9BURK|nr:O-antigen polymerase [Collimonas arenae]AIY40053.1 macromolecule metabolism; macromolecule synthesis [Collimonas arenae]